MLGARPPVPWPNRSETIAGLIVLGALAMVRSGAVSQPSGPPLSAPITADADRGATDVAQPQTALPWRTGLPLAIAVRNGRAEFDAPAAEPAARTLVIVSALARSAGPFSVQLEARPAAVPRAPATVQIQGHARREVWLKPAAPVSQSEVPDRRPADERTFYMMVRDGDVASASNYLAVQGRLRALGKRVQVYVDAQDLAVVGPELLGQVVDTFDGHVFPIAAAHFGRARDVDGDGRFTVLMSHWLTRLAGGRHAVDGYVRGADFDGNVAAPFGNGCDMMYLSAALEPGPHLRTVLAHEYTHAVILGAKAGSGAAAAPSGSRPAARCHLEEEGWLDEALAHLVEDLHGFSRSNVDYRVSAFLSQPVRYRLVVEDYYAADLFRSHGNRGATYLFLRWCADRFGPGLLPALILSDRRGAENLELATGVPFDELYREWSVALYLSGLEHDSSVTGRYRSLAIRGRLGGWELAGPRALEVMPGGEPVCWSATGTSTQFVLIAPPAGAPATTVAVSGPPEAELQVTAVPLPAGMGRIELGVEQVAGPDGAPRLRAILHERHGVGVALTAVAWEPLVPAANPRGGSFRAGALDPAGIARAFGTTMLAPNGTIETEQIPLPENLPGAVPLVVKVVGTDTGGRRVAAWAELPPPPEDSEEP
jgi:hypothetical protein